MTFTRTQRPELPYRSKHDSHVHHGGCRKGYLPLSRRTVIDNSHQVNEPRRAQFWKRRITVSKRMPWRSLHVFQDWAQRDTRAQFFLSRPAREVLESFHRENLPPQSFPG